MNSQVRDYLAELGRRGGQATGAIKLRGDSDYYREIGRKGGLARRRAKAKSKDVSTAIADPAQPDHDTPAGL